MANNQAEFNVTVVRLQNNDPSIMELDFRNHGLTSDDALSLANALKANTSLISLNLQCNNIGTDGLRALLKALEANTTLMSIDVRSIGVDWTSVYFFKHVGVAASIRPNNLESIKNTTLVEVLYEDNMYDVPPVEGLRETMNGGMNAWLTSNALEHPRLQLIAAKFLYIVHEQSATQQDFRATQLDDQEIQILGKYSSMITDILMTKYSNDENPEKFAVFPANLGRNQMPTVIDNLIAEFFKDALRMKVVDYATTHQTQVTPDMAVNVLRYLLNLGDRNKFFSVFSREQKQSDVTFTYDNTKNDVDPLGDSLSRQSTASSDELPNFL